MTIHRFATVDNGTVGIVAITDDRDGPCYVCTDGRPWRIRKRDGLLEPLDGLPARMTKEPGLGSFLVETPTGTVQIVHKQIISGSAPVTIGIDRDGRRWRLVGKGKVVPDPASES
jgi:hypothetical protein